MNRFFLICTGFLASCASPEPNHLGNPLLLPVEAVRAGTSNIVYGAKRAKVARFVEKNYDEFRDDVLNQGGPMERAVMDLAGVPQEKQFALHKELQSNPTLYFSEDREPLIVALMVHGN